MATNPNPASPLVDTLFNDMNNALTTFVSNFSSGLASEIAPVVLAGMVLSIVMFGVLSIRGFVSEPFVEVAWKLVRMSVITTIALTTAGYQTYIVDIFLTMPEDLVGSIVSGSVSNYTVRSGGSATQFIDGVYSQGMYTAEQLWQAGGLTDVAPFGYAVLVVIGTIFCLIVGTFWLFIAKIVLAVLLGVGPLFIVALLWQPLQQFFYSWLGAVLNTILTAVFVIAIFSIFLAMFQTNITQIEAGTTNLIQSGFIAFLGILCFAVLIQLPGYVAQLTGAGMGGVGRSLQQVVSGATGAAAGGAAGAYAAKKAAGNYSAARAKDDNGRRGASRLAAARGARHEFNKTRAEIKQGFPDYYRQKKS